ncbi:MAG: glycosyltransferase [Bacteroidetes bacterium]|nr:glycosyltransferase [Bacteroidota bacterium]
MKILQLCHRIPFPPVDGGNIAMYNLSKSLATNGNVVKILALNTLKHFVDTDALPEHFKTATHAEGITTDTSVRFFPAFLNLFSDESYNITRFYNKRFEERLTEILKAETYDIIQLESLFMMPYLSCARKNSKAKVVMRAHNVEHIIWERLHHSEKNIFKKWYLQILARRLKKFERFHLHTLDAVLPITADDETAFRKIGCTVPMHITPLGIDTEDYPVNDPQEAEWCLFHLGSMDWMPNLEAVEWFLGNCWEKIHNEFPSLKLYLAGRGFPKHLMEAGYANVVCEGEISDSNKYMASKQIMVVPLLSGSGMRVKIIQGMALGKTIISTTIGAEGIQYTHGENILIADTPDQYMQAVKKCMEDKNFASQTGKAARKLVAEKYSNDVIGKSVTEFYRKLISN